MSPSLIAYLVLAALAANLPFISERRLLVLPLPLGATRKAFIWRLIELFLLYVLLGLVGRWLESRISPLHSQEWPFYATTFALFIIAGYPGFVIRYFWRKPGV